MTTAASRLVLALFAGLALAACRSLPDRPGAHVDVLHQGALETAEIRDVIVAPVQNESTAQYVPERELRDGFSKALVKRRYSPLALTYVDERAREASAGASLLGEDAVLQITVNEWDKSLWDTQGVLIVDVEAWMHGSGATQEPLWAGRFQRRFSLRQEIEVAATEGIVMRSVCDRIADALLEVMPAHVARP